MVETEEVIEKHGVVFAIWDGEKIQLEKRLKGKYEGEIIIPGGSVESGETLEDHTLPREIKEEYGVDVVKTKKVGIFPSVEDGVLNIRHLYLVTEWNGNLSDPEKNMRKSEHLEATLEEALLICRHPLTQIFLQVIKSELSR
jgi:8-oxo-dGTP pyrophosphatase MutT (NUDIX family)